MEIIFSYFVERAATCPLPAGFGTFAIERKHARTGRDPRNGAPIRIAAKNVVKFRPGTELSEAVK